MKIEVFPEVVIKNGKAIHCKKWMPAMYVAYFGIIEEIVNAHGYILCIHGSVVRDFDLVAVPFDFEVKPHKEVLDAIKKAIGTTESNNDLFNNIGYEPHGRKCYTIECGAGGYFDISFTPSMQDAIKRVKEEKKNKKEIKNILSQTWYNSTVKK